MDKEYRIDKCDLEGGKTYELLNKLDPRFSMFRKTIIFFDITGKSKLNTYYQENFEKTRAFFNEIGYNFVFLPKLDFPFLAISYLSYLMPSFHFFKYDKEIVKELYRFCKREEKEEGKYYIEKYLFFLKEYLKYQGDIEVGYIVSLDEGSSSSEFYIVDGEQDKLGANLDDILNLESYLVEFIKSLYVAVYYSRHNYEPSSRFLVSMEDKLEEKSFKSIQKIISEIEKLKSSGQLIYALPLIQDKLDKIQNSLDINKMSSVVIDEDYNIILPEFGDLKIKLSHLTKVVYLLFLRHPEGIDIKKLFEYEEEIKKLYMSVSNRESHAQMMKSVQDLIAPDSKSIYTHISRIKSAFYRNMSKYFADQYIITDNKSFGSSFKYIPGFYTPFHDDTDSIIEEFF